MCLGLQTLNVLLQFLCTVSYMVHIYLLHMQVKEVTKEICRSLHLDEDSYVCEMCAYLYVGTYVILNVIYIIKRIQKWLL